MLLKNYVVLGKLLKKEFETTILLSIYNIAPKVIYHSKKKINLDFMLWKN